ncbi:hypothetical protein [Acinetobacter boissieri]|uniref:Uncharacterized protein n=1 Tax=Acinetobacter boissieri TaxID=1219383 RepID=A0A1G6GYJ4_9GAMM|nr:hypothetical protein [Acinetobacter boissieri]SDB87069.1 hypothetical protein SAMN05421733_10335 [Acinetobacter boissieri]
MTDRQQLLDTASTAFTSKTTITAAYTTTGAGIVSAISQLDVVAKIGISIALVSLAFTAFSFFMNWRYKHKQDQRADELHRLEIEKKKAELNEYKR